MNNTLLNLHNSSYQTQPDSITLLQVTQLHDIPTSFLRPNLQIIIIKKIKHHVSVLTEIIDIIKTESLDDKILEF